MPNECINTLAVLGSKDEVERFVRTVTSIESGSYSLFEKLIPFPEELANTVYPTKEDDNSVYLIKKYGSSNWYDWKCTNWGTKWGDYEISASEITQSYEARMNDTVDLIDSWHINFNYTTAWAPGENELAYAICKQFPKLKAMIQYEEPGMAFAGETLVLNGKIVKQETWEMHSLHEDISEVYWLQYEESAE